MAYSGRLALAWKITILAVVVALALMQNGEAQPLGGAAPSAQSSWQWPEPIADAMAAVTRWQRQANDLLAGQVRAIKRGEGLAALAALLVIGLTYGILHTLGPGHGKAIVAAYFLDRRRSLPAGLFAGGWVAITHTFSAIVIVVALKLAVGLSSLATLDQARLIEVIAYGLILTLGLWRLFTAATGKELHHHHGQEATDHHHHHQHDRGERLMKPDAMLGLLTLAGFVPCTGSMIVMLFAMANGVMWVGILATMAISLGMAATLAAIGIATALLRRRFVDQSSLQWLPRLLTIAAALLVAGFGGLMLMGALTRAA